LRRACEGARLRRAGRQVAVAVTEGVALDDRGDDLAQVEIAGDEGFVNPL
jgi:hypothetical protein